VGEAQRDLRGGALGRGGADRGRANGGPCCRGGMAGGSRGTPREGTGAAVMVWAASVRSRLRRARLMGERVLRRGSQEEAQIRPVVRRRASCPSPRSRRGRCGHSPRPRSPR
jgi:hypothetical protein